MTDDSDPQPDASPGLSRTRFLTLVTFERRPYDHRAESSPVLSILAAALGLSCGTPSSTDNYTGPQDAGRHDGGESLDAGAADGEDIQHPPAPIHEQSWKLKDVAVVKIVQIAPHLLVAFGETLLGTPLETGGVTYVMDHERRLFLLSSDGRSEELSLPPGPSGIASVVTDIAPGSEPNSLWVLRTTLLAKGQWIDDPGFFDPGPIRHTIYRMSVEPLGGEAEPVHESQPSFEGLDVLARSSLGENYLPDIGDTLDVARLASLGSRLGLVARNRFGALYAEQLVWREGRIHLLEQAALSRPQLMVRIWLESGSYDVMGQMANRYKVHAAFAPDGTLHAGSTALYGEIRELPRLFGDEIPAQSPGVWALTTGLAPDGMRLPAKVVHLGDEGQFYALAAGSDRIVVGGLARRLDRTRASQIRLAALDDWDVSLDGALPSSGALSAVLLNDGSVLLGGSQGWQQNPQGGSINGGQAFVARFKAGESALERVADLSLLRRSEVRTTLPIDDALFCIGGMEAGPGTHTADGDLQKLRSDGFVRCIREPEP